MATSKILKNVKRIKILGRQWLLKFTTYPELGLKTDGECDSPETPGRKIRIDSTLEPERLHEVIIHECLHGAFWWLDEKFVEEFAADLSRILLDADVRARWDH